MKSKYLVLTMLVVLLFPVGKKMIHCHHPYPTGTMKLSFQNMAGAQKLVLHSFWYINANGDSLQVDVFKYYISNLVFIKDDNTEYKVPESYYLVDDAKSDSRASWSADIPTGNYTKVRFLIGIDSARNTDGAQTGALDLNNAMFWDWNSGYIMAKLEGRSPQSTNVAGKIFYHTGGFQGPNSVLRTITLDFPGPALSDNGLANVHIKADVLEWFKTPNLLKIADLSGAQTMGPEFQSIAGQLCRYVCSGPCGLA